MSVLVHDKTFQEPINWTTSFFLGAFHVGAIVALFFFTWKAFAIAFVLWWVAGSLGIGMGYHRLLTHRGFKTPKWVEYFLTTCGTLALEGGPIAWVATHRVHHQLTDVEGDPHSPREGGLWRTWAGSLPAEPCTTRPKSFCISCRIFARINFTCGSPSGIGCRSRCWE